MKQAVKERTLRLEQQFLTFNLAAQLFAIDIGHVKEIIAYGGISFIPLAPKFVKGVLNLRGSSVPVLDLAFRFKKIQSDITKVTCIVIVEVEKEGKILDIGLVVDSVNEVISIDSENIDPSPDFGTDVHIDFINGIGKVDGKFIVIINAQAILDVKDFSALEHTIQTGRALSGQSGRNFDSQTEIRDLMKNLMGEIDSKEGSIASKAKAAAFAAAEAAAKAAAVAAAMEHMSDSEYVQDLEKVKAEAEAALADASAAANEALVRAKEKQAKNLSGIKFPEDEDFGNVEELNSGESSYDSSNEESESASDESSYDSSTEESENASDESSYDSSTEEAENASEQETSSIEDEDAASTSDEETAKLADEEDETRVI